jgi:hypothetical protein
LLKVFVIALIIITILPLISISSTVYGQEEPKKVTERFAGYVATAFWNIENEDGSIVNYNLFVRHDKSGETSPFLDRYTVYPDGSSLYEFSDSAIFQDVFTIDKKLTSATLSPVSLHMVSCNEARICFLTGEIVTVQASWTGQGPIREESFDRKTEDDTFRVKSSTDTNTRGASASVSLNGQEFQIDCCNAILVQSKHIQVTRLVT